METRIIISQIFILAIVVLIGAVAAKFRVLTRESKDMLSKVIFNISLPLMLFTNFLKLEATPRLIANSFIVVGISALVILFMLLFGLAASRVFRFRGSEAAVFRVHSMFGNTIFLGFPLISSLYGEEGLLYASMFQLISNITMWTLGVVVLTRGNGISWKKNLLKVLNPNTIAMVTGLVFFLLSIKLPKLLITPLSELGSANTWLSMLYIGAMLAFSSVGGLLKTEKPLPHQLQQACICTGDPDLGILSDRRADRPGSRQARHFSNYSGGVDAMHGYGGYNGKGIRGR